MRIGGLLRRLQDAPAHEKSWETGAAGEEALAESLLKRCPGVPVLHDRAVEAVRAALESLARPLPVHGCFCFVNLDGQAGGSGIPAFRTLTVDGSPLYHPRRLAKRLNQPGEIDVGQTQPLVDLLVQQFPPARSG